MIDTIQYFHNLKYINYPWASIIYDSIGYYSVVTLQSEPGFIRKLVDKDTLKKYELDGIFRKQGTHAFFLINIEPIIYLLVTSLITFAVLTL